MYIYIQLYYRLVNILAKKEGALFSTLFITARIFRLYCKTEGKTKHAVNLVVSLVIICEHILVSDIFHTHLFVYYWPRLDTYCKLCLVAIRMLTGMSGNYVKIIEIYVSVFVDLYLLLKIS